MSLNDKYIINGSTLSDIGDALRTSGLIPPTKEVTKSIWYRRDGDSASGSSTSTITIDQNFFQRGNAVWDGTIAKVKIVITEGNPKINDVQYYSGNTVTVDVPCTISISGSRMYPSRTYSYGCKVYPLTSDGQNIDCTQTSSYGGVYSESASVEVPNTIAVEDIANTILNDLNNTSIAFLAPFQIGASSNYTNATVFPTNIKKITDIKKLFFVSSNSDSSYITIQKLEPANTTTQYYSSMGGLGAGTTYRMKEYSFPYWDTAPADWDDKLNNSTIGYDVYFIESTRQLVQISGGGSYIINAYAIPALLIY